MEAWNNRQELRESHNCFAYALNSIDPNMMAKCKSDPSCNVPFPQPGYAAGFKRFSDQPEKGCGDMVSRLWGDNPKIRAVTFEEKCPPGTSKIALIVDPKRDYHFLRQDPDGYWSHKPGAMAVTRLDSTDRPILRPDRACFMYKKNKKDPLCYTEFCGYFCVPRNESLHMMTEVRQNGGSAGRSLRRPTRRHGYRGRRGHGTRRLRG
jgi:hypothetical protein